MGDLRWMLRDVGQRRQRWVLVLGAALMLGHGALVWWARAPGILTSQDDAAYVLLAESVRGFEYQELWTAETPPHTKYPPGYPAMLAVWGVVFGHDFDGYILLNVVASIGVLALVFAGVWRLVSPAAALLAVLMLSVNPFMIRIAGQVRSETVFAFLALLTLTVVRDAGTARRMTVAGILAILGGLTRMVGVTLVGTVGLLWLYRRQYRAAILFGLASAAVFGTWFAFVAMAPEHHAGSSYLGDAAQLFNPEWGGPVRKLVYRGERMVLLAGSIVPQLLPMPGIAGTSVDNLLGVLVLGGGLTGGLLWLWREHRGVLFFLAAYGAVLLVWPYTEERFLFPLLPILVPLTVLGLGATVSRWWPRGGRVVMLGVGGLVMVTAVWQVVPLVRFYGQCPRAGAAPAARCMAEDQQSYFAAFEYIRTELPEDAVLFSAKPEPLRLYANRVSVPRDAANSRAADGLMPYLADFGTSHILLGALLDREVQDLSEKLSTHCDGLVVEAVFPPRTYLFAIRPPGAGEADRDACVALKQHRTSTGGELRFGELPLGLR